MLLTDILMFPIGVTPSLSEETSSIWQMCLLKGRLKNSSKYTFSRWLETLFPLYFCFFQPTLKQREAVILGAENKISEIFLFLCVGDLKAWGWKKELQAAYGNSRVVL